MPTLYGVLGLGAQSMLLEQRRVLTLSHNISSAETPGYSRQRVNVSSQAPIQLGFSAFFGQGATVSAITRARDRFVENQLDVASEARAFLDGQTFPLMRLDEAFNETFAPGLGEAVDGMFNSWRVLASAPTSPAARSNARMAGQTLVDRFRRAVSWLDDTRRSIDQALQVDVGQVNALARQVATLNKQIVQVEGGSLLEPANDLRDERDRLAREIASLAGGEILDDSRLGVVILVAGHPIVEGELSNRLQTTPSPGGAAVEFVDPSGTPTDITARLTRGRLGGLLRVRDTVVTGVKDRLDQLAFTLASEVNVQHALGFGLDGLSGRNFFSVPATPPDAARLIAIDAAVAANLDAIAAGLDPLNRSDNRNALAIGALYDTPSGALAGRTYRNDLNDIVQGVARSAQDNERELAAREDSMRLLERLRESASGVSIDEEMTGLMMAQNVLAASARVVRAADDMLKEMLSIL